MDIRDLVGALLAFDTLTARQWVADALRAGLRWSLVSRPRHLSRRELVVAAAVVELLAERTGQEPPRWTEKVAVAHEQIWLVRAAQSMPRLRRLCEEEGPLPLRRRGIFAPPDFLSVA